MGRICTTCNSCTCDITLVEQTTSVMFTYSHTWRLWIKFHEYVLMKKRNNVKCALVYCKQSVIHTTYFFHFLTYCQLHIDVFFSSFILKSNLLHFVAIIRVSQNVAVIPTETQVDVWCVGTLNMCLHRILWHRPL